LTDFTEYLEWPPLQLLERLAKLAWQIGNCRKLLARAKAQAEMDKAQAVRNSMESTVSGRQQMARVESVAATSEALEMEGQIAELAEEQSFLTLLLTIKVGVNA
jgi:primosomal replication protein N